VANWTFLTSHARVLLCIVHDPGVRLRDIAASLSITERSAVGIVTDLADAGDVVKRKDGRRNRYEIQAHLLLPEPVSPATGIHMRRCCRKATGTAELRPRNGVTEAAGRSRSRSDCGRTRRSDCGVPRRFGHRRYSVALAVEAAEVPARL
jgi:hypothetical protein